MKRHLAAIVAIAAMLSGCTTTEEANTVIQSRWIGQPAELFFTRYGPPISEFQVASGNMLYTWRGGDKTRYIPPQYSTPTPVQTRTVTREAKPGVTVTKTTTSGGYLSGQPQMISPPRYEELFCELQITADPSDRIVAIRATNDTDGEGLSLSRCAEVLDAHPQK
ncbi:MULTISPECIES: hypothetical protein [Alphaproteobacteria]|uniref:Lipoprotein n=2 Tax=Alphaproteobacteria TaxID=28211 RepID=A0A512HEV1_9HYPH|nr:MULTISPECIES: hypothetical protein [Alphaproteobacteria]GEO83986.1 hypothetical protein RNA01_09180 [Ciceribacter naphthalenivorans]GLR21136.1 hypothetical protein GCM10007920_09220 [Ciceribacter naphthalenivorans]GLT03992.1 hypothetical protein GCM10007926_09220 [Sphingomonas psychrolutea]